MKPHKRDVAKLVVFCFAVLVEIFAKTVGVFEVLGSALEKLSAEISVAFVYGSLPRQEESAESDVDLMIVGSVSLDDVLTQMPAVEFRT
jgi:predicted nucleotidyltransferase